MQNIQGPCGNSTFQPLSTRNNNVNTKEIPYIHDEQLIMEERYSTTDGYFGTVRRNYFDKNDIFTF